MGATNLPPFGRAAPGRRGQRLTRVLNNGVFLVSPAPGGAWFSWVEDVELPLGVAGRLGFAVVGAAFRLLLRRSLRRLARQLESRPHLGKRTA